ncbi:MAG: hypothetical protein DCF25_19895 [Leptolyngbya foveolarum]|uniref:GUN4-like domain-containing protein n=1 Tax=Leptolyngbya foveolarum TaxID=47253 RepID=A0A2W4VWD8_9CYAN|nr:MAG: hypothetical protein DCF25_19895 [Leptolyngbya foveolarum]
MEDIVLESDAGIDYSTLHSLLNKSKFRQADKLTYDLMCKATGKPIGSYFNSEDISYFPESDLLSIEKLWNYYGNGKLDLKSKERFSRLCTWRFRTLQNAGWMEIKYPAKL